MPHVVVVPFPAQGHITPLMELSKKLAREEGFTITFINTTHNHERLLRSGNTDQLPPNIRLVAISDGLPRDHPRTAAIVELCKAVTTSMASSLIDFLQTGVDEDRRGLNTPPFTCLVGDVSFPFAQKVADACDLPRIAFWTRCASYFAAVQLFCKGIWRPKSAEDPVNKHVTPDLSFHIPGAPPIKPSDMSAFLYHGDPSDFMFEITTEPVAGVGKAAWILLNTFAELETPVVHAIAKDLKITTIGPLLPCEFFSNPSHLRNDSALWREEHDCLEWLDKKPANSVLYISFGSITIMPEKQAHEFLLGLESSKQSFLWVMRPDLISGSFTAFLEGFLERVKGRALCVAWAPQLKVLSHAAVGGFLTHGGWNSVAEAIAAGVPMLGWPYFADQKSNCRCIVDGWKVGLHLEENEDGLVTKEEVEDKVHLLMEEGGDGVELRERVAYLRDATRRALSQGGSSHRNWDAFIQGIKLMKPSTSSISSSIASTLQKTQL